MKKRRGKVTNIMIGAAAVLLAVSAIGSTRAALTYYSEDYLASINVKSIGVTLVENGKDISWRDYTHKDDKWQEHTGVLLETMLKDAGDSQLVLNKEYKEQLSVRNSGTIDAYVRVIVYRYWEDDSGKRTDLSPDLIRLNWTEQGWIEDKTASTAERTILYYPDIVRTGASTPLFADKLSIPSDVATTVDEKRTTDENGYTTITTTYVYDGVRFVLEANVDAVQTHNAAEAIKSAWGVDVDIAEDGKLSLK